MNIQYLASSLQTAD